MNLAGGGEDRVEPPVCGDVEHLPRLVVGGEGDTLQQRLQPLLALQQSFHWSVASTWSLCCGSGSESTPKISWIRSTAWSKDKIKDTRKTLQMIPMLHFDADQIVFFS
jgi:hypothetical protein